jgi:hypothetical protein
MAMQFLIEFDKNTNSNKNPFNFLFNLEKNMNSMA